MADDVLTPAGAAASTFERWRLPTFNELVRILRQGNEFLARPTIAEMLIAKQGDTEARALKWGVLNRAFMPYDMNITLPPIDPAWVGVPLHLAKFGGSGTTGTIAPAGYALDRITKPTINGGATFPITQQRLYVFVTDGANWFAGGG